VIVKQVPLDLAKVFTLEPHGPDTFIGESPKYSWGRIYGGLVVAQALWAATQTVRPEHLIHSLHAYFILGGEIPEPVRYEVDRVRNGRSFSTRRVLARQSSGAILTLECSFQVTEGGPEAQTATIPTGLPKPSDDVAELDAGILSCDAAGTVDPPRSAVWARYPLELGDDPRLQACGLAYLSDLNPTGAVMRCHPSPMTGADLDDGGVMTASLDHSLWFHRPGRADEWTLIDMNGQSFVGSRGLATGLMFGADGTHVATIAQDVLIRDRRN
jgi:acyl-CoA thioesterase-2